MGPSAPRGLGTGGFSTADPHSPCAGAWSLMPVRQIVIQQGVSRSEALEPFHPFTGIGSKQTAPGQRGRSLFGDRPMIATAYQKQFEALLPQLKEAARFAFRRRSPENRAEAIADVIA